MGARPTCPALALSLMAVCSGALTGAAHPSHCSRGLAWTPSSVVTQTQVLSQPCDLKGILSPLSLRCFEAPPNPGDPRSHAPFFMRALGPNHLRMAQAPPPKPQWRGVACIRAPPSTLGFPGRVTFRLGSQVSQP